MQAWLGIQVRYGKGLSPSLGGRRVEGQYCSLLAASETSFTEHLGMLRSKAPHEHEMSLQRI